jgi:hypothetical protein
VSGKSVTDPAGRPSRAAQADLGTRAWLLSRDVRDRRRERRAGRLLLAAAGALACWTGALAVWLPPGPHQEWSVGVPGLDKYALTWVGLDCLETVCLAGCGWRLYRGSPDTRTWALLAVPLFVLDAWFDVLTAFSRRDLAVALTLAAGAELPVAAALGWVAWKARAFSQPSTPPRPVTR